MVESESSHDQPSSSTASGVYKILKPYNALAKARDFCTFITFFIFLALIVGAVPAVTRLLIYLQPSLPTAAIQSSSITLLNVSSSKITARWDITFSITNPNSQGFFYERVVIYAANRGGVRLASFTIPTFRQPGSGTTANLSASFPSLELVVNDCTRNGTVVRECGGVELRVEVEAAAVYERWTWPEKGNLVDIECDVLKVVFLPGKKKMELGAAAGCMSDGEWRRLEDKCRTIFWNYVYVAAMCVGILAFSL
ncbi:hypothetical protein LINPERPRIM_LOCUS6394 [Linum perenne]